MLQKWRSPSPSWTVTCSSTVEVTRPWTALTWTLSPTRSSSPSLASPESSSCTWWTYSERYSTCDCRWASGGSTGVHACSLTVPLQAHAALQSHQPRGPGVGCFGLLHIRLLSDVHGGYDRDQPGVHVQMCVQRDQSAGGESASIHHLRQVAWTRAESRVP